MGWDDRPVFEQLDSWIADWAQQYNSRDEASIVDYINMYEPMFESNEQRKMLRTLADGYSLENIEERMQTYFSEDVQFTIGMHGAFVDAEKSVYPSVYAEHIAPFVAASQTTWNFLAACCMTKERVGILPYSDVNKIFNHAYGNLDGFLRSQRAIRQTYASAISVAEHANFAGDRAVHNMAELSTIFDITETEFFSAIFRGIEGYKPVLLEGKLLLRDSDGPFRLDL